MSQEKNPPTTQPARKNSTWLYLGIIAVLLGTCIYLFVSRSRMADQAHQATSQRDSIAVDRDTLQKEYNTALQRLDDLVSKNTVLNNEINDKDGEIARMKAELKGIMSKKNQTAEELKRAQTLIAELNSKVKGYEERIAMLEKENDSLGKTNYTVTRQRDSINAEAARIKKLGSVLHASNIRIEAKKLKRNGKVEKETAKARKTDLLRVTFDIDENRIAENGEKELYLRITGPDGNLLSNAAYGSGITTTSEGAALNYTMLKEVSLMKGQPLKDVSLDWHQDSEYKKGDYLIEIYNEGFKIGGGSVTLR